MSAYRQTVSDVFAYCPSAGEQQQFAMPLTPYLDGHSFDPDTLKSMGEAFELACDRLGITDKTDPFRQMVAGRVIAFAKRDVNDPAALCEKVIRSL
jgi:hypothetical protein